MVEGYVVVKTLHVLFAIVAVGVNVSYPVLLARAERDRDALAHVLRSVKVLDNHVANPSYVLLLVTGAALVEMGGLPWSTPWLSAALGLYVLLALLGLLVYSPLLKKQVRLAEDGQAGSEAYETASRRGTIVGMVLAVVAVTIVVLMVAKPALW